MKRPRGFGEIPAAGATVGMEIEAKGSSSQELRLKAESRFHSAGREEPRLGLSGRGGYLCQVCGGVG